MTFVVLRNRAVLECRTQQTLFFAYHFLITPELQPPWLRGFYSRELEPTVFTFSETYPPLLRSGDDKYNFLYHKKITSVNIIK